MCSGPLHKSCQLSPWGQLTQVSIVARGPIVGGLGRFDGFWGGFGYFKHTFEIFPHLHKHMIRFWLIKVMEYSSLYFSKKLNKLESKFVE